MTFRGEILRDTLVSMPQGLKSKNYTYKIENELNTRILDSWLESADRWAGPRKFWIFFAQEPPVTWKFDYSSKKNTRKCQKFDPKS